MQHRGESWEGQEGGIYEWKCAAKQIWKKSQCNVKRRGVPDVHSLTHSARWPLKFLAPRCSCHPGCFTGFGSSKCLVHLSRAPACVYEEGGTSVRETGGKHLLQNKLRFVLPEQVKARGQGSGIPGEQSPYSHTKMCENLRFSLISFQDIFM